MIDALQTELAALQPEYDVAREQIEHWTNRARDLEAVARYLTDKLTAEQARIKAEAAEVAECVESAPIRRRRTKGQ